MNYIYTFLGWIMDWCYGLLGNYGWAIVLFTFITKIILLPLSLWTYFQGITMIKIQPDINFIKVKYYGQPDQIAEEQSKLFKENKYNPLVSLIPTVVQLVLLIGVVGVIRLGIDNPAIDMHFGPINLGEVPAEVGISLIWSPITAGVAAFILCIAQNRSSVLQAEQSKFNKYGLTIFSVGLSLYLGWFVAIGTAFYWVCSNLFAVLQLYICNWIIKPRQYVDYEKLEESRRQLEEIQSVGNKQKDGFFSENKRKERADYKRFFSIENKHLVFYAEGKGFYKYFKGIIEYLLKNTNIIIHYITSDPNDGIFEMEKENPQIKGYYVGENRLITLMMKMDADIVCMTMPDLDNFHIKRSYIRNDVEYIYIDHAMDSGNLGLRKGARDNYDVIFCSATHRKIELEQQEKLYGSKKKKIIEVGYPLLDEMRYEYSRKGKKSHKKHQVLIAPSYQVDNIVDLCLDQLCDILKGSDYEIIVRPHPQEVKRKRELMEKLKEKYSLQGIEFQTDFSSNSSVFDADILITDWSGIAFEYAFTTLRPVLFINTPMKIINPEWDRIDIRPVNITLRHQIGKEIEIEQLNEVTEKIKELLDNVDEYKNSINNILHEHIYNLDHSSEYAGKWLIEEIQHKIANRK